MKGVGGIVGQQRKAEKLLMSLDKEGGLPLTLHDVGGDEDDVQNDDDAKDGACDYEDGDDHEKCCYFLQKKRAAYH